MRTGRDATLGIGESFGVVSLAFATRSVRYPVRKQELVRRIGPQKIYWTRRQVINLQKVLQESDTDEFQNFADLLATVAHHRDKHIRPLTDFTR